MPGASGTLSRREVLCIRPAPKLDPFFPAILIIDDPGFRYMVTSLERVGSISYDRPKIASTDSVSLPIELKVSPSTQANALQVETWISLDPSSVAQYDTIAITAGSTGNLYSVDISSGGITETYIYKQKLGDDAAAIAAGLGRLLNIDNNIQVSWASGSSILDLRGTMPGNTYSISVDDSTTSANLTVTNVTSASGSIVHRKIYEITLSLELSVSDLGSSPRVKADVQSFTGEASPSLLSSFTMESTAYSKTLDQLQTEAGIPRSS